MRISIVALHTMQSEPIPTVPFPVRSLAGMTGCQLFLRPGSAALLCFHCVALLVCGAPQKDRRRRIHLFRFLHKMLGWALGAGATCLRVPRKMRDRKRRI